MTDAATRGVSRRPSSWIRTLFGRIGVCGNAGVIVGAVTGLVLTLLDLIEDGLELTGSDVVATWLILAAAGWLMLVSVFIVFVRWPSRSVAAPALVNSALVTGLTMLICWIAGLFDLAWLIGPLAGLVIGYLLCGLYRRVSVD